MAARPDFKVDGGSSTEPAPEVSSISFSGAPADGDTYHFGETIEVEVAFDQPVTVTGHPQVALTVGSRIRYATPHYDTSGGGSPGAPGPGVPGVPGAPGSTGGSSYLYFEYDVQAADVDTDGVSIAANAIRLNGGSIKAASDGTINADLTHTAVPADANQKVDGSRVPVPAVRSISFNSSPASGDTYELGESIDVRVEFDRPVRVAGTPQLALTIGSRTRQVALPGYYSDADSGGRQSLYFGYQVQAADVDTDGISIGANAISLNGGSIKAEVDGITDADLTHAAVAADRNRKVDGSRVSAPVVSRISFNRSPASGDTYELGESIDVRVAFDRPLTVTGNPQVTLTIGSRTRHATLTGVTSSGSDGSGSFTWSRYFEYTVQAEDRDTDGISIGANAINLNGGSIKAEADGITDADLTHAAVAADPNRKVDGSRVTTPTVSRISFNSSPASGDTYELGERIEVAVEFDRPLTVTGTPQLALTIGNRTRQITLPPGYDDTSSLFFVYRVQAADVDTDGISIAANAIELNGGSIKAAADGTTDADLTHAAVAAAANRKVDGSRVTTPAVSRISFNSSPASGDTYELGETIQVGVAFNRPVTVTGTPQVALTIGSRIRHATYDPSSSGAAPPSDGTGASYWYRYFEYRVQAADVDTDGISIAANAIGLNGGSIKAEADGTTDADLSHVAVAADAGHKVDGSRVSTPLVSHMNLYAGLSGSSGETVTIERGETIIVVVTFDRPVRVTGSPQVALIIGSRTRQASYAPTGTDLNESVIFEYTVQAADEDTDGIGVPANAISLNSGSITAADGVTAADLRHDGGTDHTHRVDGGLVTAPKALGLLPYPPPANGHTYGLGETITVLVAFDKPVTVTGSPRVALTIGTLTRHATHAPNVSVDITPLIPIPGLDRLVEYFTYTVRTADLDSDGISFPANAISLNGGSIDAAADRTTAADLTHDAVPAGASGANYYVDGGISTETAPAVSSISFSGAPAGGDTYELGETITVRVEFDSPVTVTGTPRVALTIGSGTGQATLPGSSVPGPGGSRSLYFEYEVQAQDRDTDGISIAANAISRNGGSIKSAAEVSTDADLTHDAVPADSGRKVDGSRVSAPEVISLHIGSRPSSGNTYVRGDEIEVEVGFSEPITVTGSPELALTVGSASRGAHFLRSGARTLWFRYRVQGQDSDSDSDGIGVAADALTPKGGTIKDLAGNDAHLDLGAHAIANAGDHRVDAELQDDVAPEILSVAISSLPQSGASYVLGEAIEIQVEFSEPVIVTGSPRLKLNVGSTERNAPFASSWQQFVRFQYIVQTADSGRLGVGVDPLDLNSATILDAAGNAAVLRLDSAQSFAYEANGVRQDQDSPTVTSVIFESRPLDGRAYAHGDIVQVEVRFSEPVTVTGMPRLALAIGTEIRRAAFFSSEQEYVRFRYTVQEDDRDADGITVADEGLSLNGGWIRDAAGNAADLSLATAAVERPGHRVDGGSKSETVPVRAAVTSQPRSGGTYGLGESIDVEVQFNKEVTVTGQPQLELTIGSESPGAGGSRLEAAQEDAAPVTRVATFVSSANERMHFRYVVRAEDSGLGGRVTIANDALRLERSMITDATGEQVADDNLRLDHAEVVHGDMVDAAMSEPALMERVSVTSEPQADLTYRLGESIMLEVVFSKSVTVTGAPQLGLVIESAAAERRATLVSADDRTIRFRYVVQEGDRDDDGIGIPANPLHLNGGTIIDVVGEAVSLDLDQAQIVVPGHGVNGEATDNTPPMVESVAIVSETGNGGYRDSEVVSAEVRFSEPVAVTGTPQLALDVGAASRTASFSGVSSDTVAFVYTVQEGDRDDDGIGIPANALRLNGATIRDSGGNDAELRTSEVQPDRGQLVNPGPRIGCKQPGVAAARVVASRLQESALPAPHAFELALELDENRDGSEQPVALGCIALVEPEREFSYAITAGDDSRFAITDSTGLISYTGRGENAEQTTEYELTVAATDERGATVLMKVAVAIANANDRGVVTLSTIQPRVGERLSAALTDQDDVRQASASWQWWRRQAPSGEWTAIEDATAARYTPAGSDGGHSLQARVSYADEHGAQRAESAPTQAVELEPARRNRMLQLGLTGFGRSVGASAVSVIGQRFVPAPAAADETRMAHTEVTLNRRSLRLPDPEDAAALGRLARSLTEAFGVRVRAGGAIDFDPVSGSRLLSDSAFRVERSHGGGRWGVWGSGDLSSFTSELEGFKQDGTVLTGFLGADYRFAPDALAGLAASYSNLDLTSAGETAGDATLTGALVSVYPYGFWTPEQWLGIWGIAGFGTGAAELKDAGGSTDGAIRTWLGAIGQRVELLSGSGFSLAAKTDGFITTVTSSGGLPEVDASAWRARLLLEGGLEWRPGDSRLAGSVELGARLDGGDAERGLGAEGGAELSYTHTGSGLGFSGRGRLLLAHEDTKIRDWGASATVSWEPPGLASGLALSVAPVWGQPASGVSALWRSRQMVSAADRGDQQLERASLLPDAVDLKVSYGLSLLQGSGRLAPFAEIGLQDAAARRLRAGVTVDISDPAATHSLQLEAFGERAAAGGAAAYHFGIGGTVEF